jgi:hypothetical protein
MPDDIRPAKVGLSAPLASPSLGGGTMTTTTIAGSTLPGEAAQWRKKVPLVRIDFAREQKNRPRIFQPFKRRMKNEQVFICCRPGGRYGDARVGG